MYFNKNEKMKIKEVQTTTEKFRIHIKINHLQK